MIADCNGCKFERLAPFVEQGASLKWLPILASRVARPRVGYSLTLSCRPEGLRPQAPRKISRRGTQVRRLRLYKDMLPVV